MNIPLQSITARAVPTRVRRRPLAVTDTGSKSSEAVSIWYGLGLPLTTFCFWLGGMLLLRPWAGFLIGLGLSFFVGARLIAAARR